MDLKEAIEGIQSNKEKTRYNCFKYLLPLSEQSPEILYPAWDTFLKVLRLEAVSNKYVAIPLIANLTRVDVEGKFEKIFDEFYDLLLHESPVVSPHIAGVSGIIIKAKPALQSAILDRLLNTDRSSKCRHKELLKSYVIDALDDCFENITDKTRIMAYVQQQLESASPKTKKKAKEFLRKRTNN